MPQEPLTPGQEPRYDAETLRKVIVLAERLKNRQQETFTAREMESIGAEVGLAPGFIRDALAEVAPPQPATRTAPHQPLPRGKDPLVPAWWSVGWMLPTMIVPILGNEVLHLRDGMTMLLMMVSWAVYIGGGIFLTNARKQHAEEAAAEGAVEKPNNVSRSQLLDALFVLQSELEAQRQHRAFLSIDVAGSTEMKQGASDLAVEYSFGQFRRWVEEIVAYCGGEMQFAAGDGIMASFPDNGAAIRSARLVVEGLARFNAEQNRLSKPFRVRCGVSAGLVPLERGGSIGHLHSVVVDRAAALQKHAAPGSIIVGAEVRSDAEAELGDLEPAPAIPGAGAGFAWNPLALPAAQEAPASETLYRRS